MRAAGPGQKRRRDDSEVSDDLLAQLVPESKRARPDEEGSDLAAQAIACVARCGFAADVLPALRCCKSLYDDVDLWRLVHRAKSTTSLLEMAARSGNPDRVKWLIDSKLCAAPDFPEAFDRALETPFGERRAELLLSLVRDDCPPPAVRLSQLASRRDLEEVAIAVVKRQSVAPSSHFWPSVLSSASEIEKNSWERLALVLADLKPVAKLMSIASRKGWEAVVSAHLRAGVLPNALPDHSTGCSPLADAAAAGHCKIMTLLLDAGADINNGGVVSRSSTPTLSPVASAAKAGQLQAVRLLAERRCSVDQKALLLASAEGNADVVFLLLGKWATGLPADILHLCLLEACSEARTSLAVTLIERGALGPPGKVATARLTSAFQRACASTRTRPYMGAEHLAIQLLDMSIGPDGRSEVAKRCRKQLLSVIQNGREELALKLLECGALDAASASKSSRVLTAGVESGLLSVVTKVLALQAAALDFDFLELFRLALRYGFDDVGAELLGHVEKLQEPADAPEPPLHTACVKRMEKTALRLLYLGCRYTSRRRAVHSVIHAACRSGLATLVARLIKALPALISTQDDGRALPLHVASKAGHVAVIKVLIDEGGADVNGGVLKTNSGTTPLYLAAEGGEVDAARALLERGADPNIRTVEGSSPLAAAAKRGNTELVSMLIACPGAAAMLKRHDRNGGTPLTWAVEHRHSEVVKLLLTVEGADPDVRVPPDAEPCLHTALLWGDEATARHLLEAGADPNLRDAELRTAGHAAATHGSTSDLVIALIAAQGLDWGALNAKGTTALTAAILYGHSDVVEALVALPGVDCNARDWSGMTALMHAAQLGDGDAVEALIDAGADLNARDLRGRTALISAIMGGHEWEALALIEAGADVNLADAYDFSPLHLACEQKLTAVAQALILKGANVLAEDELGRRPILLCCDDPVLFPVALWVMEKGEHPDYRVGGGTPLRSFITKGASVACTRRLIALGADVNSPDKAGRSPVALACINKHEKLALCLLEAGADPTAADSSGETVLDIACRMGLAEVALDLLDRGAYSTQKHRPSSLATPNLLCVAVMAGAQMQEVVARLLQLGADRAAAQCEGGLTPFAFAMKKRWLASAAALVVPGQKIDAKDFHLAVEEGAEGLMAAFLSAGFAPDTHSSELLPALHRCCREGCSSMAALLLANGANVNLRANGVTPLQAALASGLQDGEAAIALVKLLLERGADVRAVDANGSHSLHLLPYEGLGLDAVIDLLVNAGAPVNAQDASGKTALAMACAKNNVAAADALLRRGADPRVGDRDGLFPLHHACRVKKGPSLPLVTKLFEAGAGGNVNATDGKGRTPLHLLASVRNQQGVIGYVLKQPGINVDAQDSKGRTSLAMACAKNNIDAAEALLRRGANPLLGDRDGLFPLHHACSAEKGPSLPLVTKLFEAGAGANINATDGKGRTPLHLLASLRNQQGVIGYILKQPGINVNAQDSKGRTPLHCAAKRGLVDVVKLLLDANADPTLRAKSGHTPLQKAREPALKKLLALQ